ncbi:unnamed protein product [Rotaria socialis]|uniref:NADP-dependent oxidoreductase domain-containing protein n=1 Tax=Rotaria socialis TaxID=392032 RepID=A0A821ID72_9BILA|nr:unnamed protein product [Rotaria socialis]CAF3249491.1 unnamed protein product [Rotaria socialis]CAF3419668.1 unnamed protein product [Rotaria socialis]CAF3702287.1 unnamed protein product [Rotaria socialis]CAF3795455.1 unnamed protein product [Rotaria socialis]
MPRLIYGTAWKKEATIQLVIKTILNGFRGIDTAYQPKHYTYEDLVGQALVELQTKYNILRKDLFIQTKFTSINGQDQSKPLPYNARSSLAERLYDDARHKPCVIQNRFYAETNFDGEITRFCREKNIYYQSFWTLTANPQILEHPLLQQLAEARQGTLAQVFFRFLIYIGLTPLTGTTDEKHVKEDQQVLHWPSLDHDSIDKLKKLIEN